MNEEMNEKMTRAKKFYERHEHKVRGVQACAKQFYVQHETKVKVAAGVLATVAIKSLIANRARKLLHTERVAYISYEQAWSNANPEAHAKLGTAWRAYKNVCDEHNLKYFLD